MHRRRAAILMALPIGLYVFAFCTVPLGLMLLYSFWQVDFAVVIREFTLANYAQAVGSETYRFLILKALAYGAGIALITAVIAYPLAFFIAKRVRLLKSALLTALLIPLYTGDLVRIFAWRVILGAEGVLNSLPNGWADPRADLGTPQSLRHCPRPHLQLPAVHGPGLVGRLRGAGRRPDRGRLRPRCHPCPGLPPRRPPAHQPGTSRRLPHGPGSRRRRLSHPQLVGGSSGVTITSAIHDLFGAAFDWPMASALAWLLLATLAILVAAAVLVFARSPLGQGAVTR